MKKLINALVALIITIVISLSGHVLINSDPVIWADGSLPAKIIAFFIKRMCMCFIL
jgi:hypothetical protein